MIPENGTPLQTQQTFGQKATDGGDSTYWLEEQELQHQNDMQGEAEYQAQQQAQGQYEDEQAAGAEAEYYEQGGPDY